MQTILLHRLNHPSKYHMECSYYNMAQTFPANHWTPHRRSQMDMFDVSSLVLINYGVFGGKLEAPNISIKTLDVACLLVDHPVLER